MNSFFEKGIAISEDVYLRTGDAAQAIAVLDRTCSMCKSQLPCRSCVIDLKRGEYENPRKVVIKEYAVTAETRMTYRAGEVVYVHRRRPERKEKIVAIERHPTMPGFIKFKRK
jgi:hypothetical protein